jgi:aryl-alcohol dehydrogenase-like predicted oxidoreductase
LQTRRLGRNGPEITTVGFGSWALGGSWKFGWGRVDDDESVAAIRRAVELGVNWVDTAAVYGYGHSEEVVGRAVAPLRPGEDVYVFTKCGRSWYGRPRDDITTDLRPESIRFECERSLRRLGLERIDLYQFHWPDHLTGTPVEESWATMVELVDEGKARWIGVCNFDADLIARCNAVRPIDSVQPPLSLLARGTRTQLIPYARDNGAGVIAYSPLASGLLGGHFDRDRLATLDETDFRRNAPPFQEPALSANLALAERLREIARGLGTEVAPLAIAWVLAQPGVTGAIVGARRPAQVDGWIDASELELSESVLAEIDRAIAETGAGSDEVPRPPPHLASASGTPSS